MADLNQQAQDLAEIMERVNDEMRRFGKISEETAAALKAGSDARAKELKAGGAAAADALGAVAKAGMASAKAMYDGQKGAAAFNGSLDAMSEAATAAGVALTFLIPGGPVFKLLVAGVTAAVGAVAAYTKAANEMSDKLYKGYSGLQKSGAAAADGMTGLYNDAKKLGLSMNELGDFVSLVGENSKDLALFGGTVFQGRKQFAEMGKALEGTREGFFRLGMDQQEQMKAQAGYLRLQSAIGQTQKKTTDELAESTRKYMVEQDALTKLTGMTREDQEKAREEIRSQERFGAKLMELRQQGKDKEAKALEDAYLVLRSQSKEAAQGFADISTNNVQTEAAQKSIMGTQGESMRVAQEISAGQISAVEGVQRVAKAHGDTVDALGATMGQIGTYNQTFGDLAGDLRLKALAQGDVVEQMNKVTAEQQKLLTGQGDQLVNNQAQLLKTQQEANKAAEDFVMQGIAPAQSAMISLAEATRNAAGKLNEMTGKKGEYGEKGTGTMAGSLAATGSGALTGALIGSVVPVIGTAVGGAVGGALGFLGYEMFGGGGEEAAKTGAQKEAGRATGSLGATGKLIEDFGTGTPMTLHGREGVITEDQLNKFAEQAMSMNTSTPVPGLGDAPKKIQDLTKKQVDTQQDIVNLSKDNKTAAVKQQLAMKQLAKQEKDLTVQDVKNTKEFISERQDYYDDILDVLDERYQALAGSSQGGAGGGGPGVMDQITSALGTLLGGGAGGSGAGGGGAVGGGGGGVGQRRRRSGSLGGGSPAGAEGGGEGGEMFEGGPPQPGVIGKLLDYIGQHESGGNYNILVGGKTNPDLSNMTIGEVMQFQKQMLAQGHESTAVGKYQIINSTLSSLVKEGFANLDDKFDPATQDKLAVGLLKRRGLDNYMSGKLDANAFADRLSMEWASLPYHTGQSYYAGVGSNKSGEGRDKFMESVFAKDGGMFSGPMSGYPATLHGEEAVIPLKDGAVPANIPSMDALVEQNQGVRDEIKELRQEMMTMLAELTQAVSEPKDDALQARMVDVLENISRYTSQSADSSRKMIQVASN